MFAGLDRLAGEVDAEGPRGVGLIHADPAPRRVLRRPDGGAALTAWGHAAVGPRVWDVATVAVHARRFHQHDPTTWARFRVGYGDDDLVESARFGRWCARRESAIIADDARGAGPGSPALREIRRRIGELRDRDGARGPTERHWRSV